MSETTGQNESMRTKKLMGFLMAIAIGGSAWALEKDGAGVYQIGSSQDLQDFAALVNGGQVDANAVLTADIDFAGCQDRIATNNYYTGVFDGQGHKVTVAYDNAGENSALFVNISGTVCNLVVDGTINTNAKFAAGIACHTRNANAMIRNCTSLVNVNSTVNGDGTHGGILAVADSGGKLENCVYAGTMVSTDKCTNSNGGLIGYASSAVRLTNCLMLGDMTEMGEESSMTFSRCSGNSAGTVTLINCYYKNPYGGLFGDEIQVTDEQISSGWLCFMLNNGLDPIVWYQTLGTDQIPFTSAVGHQQVYASGHLSCDGKPDQGVTFNNDPSTVTTRDEHNFEEGTCTACGQKDPAFCTQDEDGFYRLSNGAQLSWFASYVNNGNVTACAKLDDDIDMSDFSEEFAMIGLQKSGNYFAGTFDGQGHRISNLILNRPETDYVGLFSCVTGGANISNLILDESCVFTGNAFMGVIGGSNGSGTCYFTGLGNEGTVTGTAQNVSGIIGVSMSSGCTFYVDRCYVTGSITGGRESATISGWCGGLGAMTNTWSIASIEGCDSNQPFCRAGNYTNCWCNVEGQAGNVTLFDSTEAETGVLAFRMNGNSISNPVWYQTIGEDIHPTLDSTHGIPYVLGEVVGDIHDNASYLEFVSLLTDYLKAYCDEVIATKSLVDDLNNAAEAVVAPATLEEFIPIYEELMTKKAQVEASAAIYQAYADKVVEVKQYLADNTDFFGDDRDLLELYLESDDEPSELHPLGGALYITENHIATNQEIKAETTRVQTMLDKAIETGYGINAELTRLIVNPAFLSDTNGWNIEGGTPWFVGNEVLKAGEFFRCNFDMNQTITGLRNGIYEVRANAVFRCLPWERNTAYAAMLYANDNVTFVKNYFDEYQPIDGAEDGVNCNTGNDLQISDSEGTLLGYVPQGPNGYIHFVFGRYENTVLAEVKDGTLTIGIRNTGTGNDRDWCMFSNFRLFFRGDLTDAGEALDNVLSAQAARANVAAALQPETGGDEANYFPNYSAQLRGELVDAADAVATTADNASKLQLVGRFTNLFNDFLNCRRAYREASIMNDQYEGIIVDCMTDSLITQEVYDAEMEAIRLTWEGLAEGTFSTAEAAAIAYNIENNPYFVAQYGERPAEVDGVYQIAKPANLRWFASKVNGGSRSINGVLTTDLDLKDFKYVPIGMDESVYFAGQFDGQGHRISNLYVDRGDANFGGLFGVVGPGCKISNLVLDATCTIKGAAFCGLVGESVAADGQIYLTNLGNEGTVIGSAQNSAAIFGCCMSSSATVHIVNCYATGKVQGARESATISGWMGGKGEVTNCWSIAEISGCDGDQPFCRNGIYSNCWLNLSNQNGTGSGVNVIQEGMLESGALCYELNTGNTFSPKWFQTLGSDGYPVLDPTHGIVYSYEGTYTNENPNPGMAALIYSAEQLSSNASDSEEGQHIEYLIDGDATTHWHSDYHNECTDTYHYVQVRLDEEYTGNLTLYMQRRASGNDHPTEMIVWGSQDGIEFTEITKLDTPFKGQGTVVTADFSVQGVKYLRFAASNCYGSNGYRTFWHAAEIQLYGTTTAIKDIQRETPLIKGIYNIAGQKLQRLQKGLNIVDGKKVMVK